MSLDRVLHQGPSANPGGHRGLMCIMPILLRFCVQKLVKFVCYRVNCQHYSRER
jgi:hypothetical protein